MENVGTMASEFKKFLKSMPSGPGQIDEGFLDKWLAREKDFEHHHPPVCGTTEWKSFLSNIEGIGFRDPDVRRIFLD